MKRDDEDNWFVAEGERNFDGTCDETFCQTVDATQAEVAAITSMVAEVVEGTDATAAATGVTAVAHSSGALILTGPASYIGGTLATAGASAVRVLAAPATLTATAVSIVAMGGAVYLCRE